MEKFSYIEKECSQKLNSSELSRYGEMGWNLVNFSTKDTSVGETYYYIFKRKEKILL